ncbi:MAG: PAS domain-containing protein [Acidobacteriota bacterium]|nr:MAG: PAS domain-containing protein [Acidobacteriota bacterium]
MREREGPDSRPSETTRAGPVCARYEALLAEVSEGVLCYDLDIRLIELSDSAAILFGLEVETARGSLLADVLPAAACEGLRELTAQLGDRGGQAGGELKIVRDDVGGVDELALELKLRSVDEEDGLRLVMALARDVSMRRSFDRALRRIGSSISGLAGNGFFRALVRNLAQELNVSRVILARVTDPSARRMRVLAFWNIDRIGKSFEYDLPGTP